MCVVKLTECFQFSFKVTGVPEEHLVKVFPAKGSDQSFDERMRVWCIGDCFCFGCTQYLQVRQPLVIQEEWVVIRAELFRCAIGRDGRIGHAAESGAVDVASMDSESNDTARELVHDHKQPVVLQQDGFAAEEVNTP